MQWQKGRACRGRQLELSLMIKQLTQSILYGIEQVFPAPDGTGCTGGQKPLPEKKITRGEAD